MRRLALAVAFAGVAALSVGAGHAGAASTAGVVGSFPTSQLGINGEPDDDQIVVFVDGATITVTDSGGIAPMGAFCAAVDGNTVACQFDPPDPVPPANPFGPVGMMSVSLEGGNDSFTNQNLVARGSISGSTGDKVIVAGPGDQEIDNGSGTDSIDGGEGNDSIGGGGSVNGADALSGGAGTDQLSYFGTQGVSVTQNGLPDDGRLGEGDNANGFESISGTDGDDSLGGDDSGTTLIGQGGNDVLFGLGGADGLFGGTGDDALIGGAGPDNLQCESGFDSVVAEPIDLIAGTCERQGAAVAGEMVRANAKGKGKLRVSCPLDEAFACVGQLALLSNGKQIGRGAFEVSTGVTEGENVRLTKKGRKLLAANDGKLLVTAEARTQEPAGVTVSADRVVLVGPM